jgi:hypothetical protein
LFRLSSRCYSSLTHFLKREPLIGVDKLPGRKLLIGVDILLEGELLIGVDKLF